MAQVTLKGNPVNVDGQLPQKGAQAPAFSLVGGDLADVTLENFAGKRKVLNIFPSVDTPTCATSVRKFNVEAGKLANTVVLCISADLPFAQKRFCGAEGLENVVNLSTLRGREFLELWRGHRQRPAGRPGRARRGGARRAEQGAAQRTGRRNRRRAELRGGPGGSLSPTANPLRPMTVSQAGW